jgi:hypothetical protein
MARKKIYKTRKGKMIDMEAMRTAGERTVAAGNMKVNAKGDELGKGGKVVRTVKERVAPHYEAKKQTARTSLKPPIKKRDAQINTPVEEQVVEDVPEVIKEEPVVSVKTRDDGSEYKEIMYADGSIETEEIKPATKKKTKKKTSKKASKKKT